MSETLSKATFQSVEGERFILPFEDGIEIELTLDKVSSKEHLDTGDTENFALQFSGSKSQMLEQRCYTMNHKTLGAQAIFIVPVGERDDRVFYEAVYSRKLSQV